MKDKWVKKEEERESYGLRKSKESRIRKEG